jgi:hypothetical protein
VRSRSTKWKRVSPYVTRHSLNTEPDTGQGGGRGRLPFGFVAFPSARLAEDRARARATDLSRGRAECDDSGNDARGESIGIATPELRHLTVGTVDEEK